MRVADRYEQWVPMLKMLLMQKGCSNQKLAEMVGVTPHTVCMWNRGALFIGTRTAYKVAAVLGEKIDDLYEFIEYEFPKPRLRRAVKARARELAAMEARERGRVCKERLKHKKVIKTWLK